MKLKITKKISESFSSYKNKYNARSKISYDSSCENDLLGRLHWTTPEEVLWLYATNNDEGYDGSQTQIGVKIDGTIVWGYFSHCSCYGYEDYKGEVEELKEDNLIHTGKYYEMENVDMGVLEIMKERLREISKRGIKDIKKEKSKECKNISDHTFVFKKGIGLKCKKCNMGYEQAKKDAKGEKDE